MPNKDDEHAFEHLSDLLGPEENLHIGRQDLFETHPTSNDASHYHVSDFSFDLDAFERSRRLPIFEPEERPSTHSYICLNGVRDYALEAHAGQLNRYTKVPNWKHLAEVAGLVSTCSSNTPRAIALAWLHHTVADTTITLRDIERKFGAVIADGMRCLTGSSNTLISPEIRRERDRQRLAEGDADVHTVKLADMAVSLADIVHHDPDRARGGHLENMRLDIAVLTHGDEGLKVLVRDLWTEALRRLSSA